MPDHQDVRNFLNDNREKQGGDVARFEIKRDGRWFHDGTVFPDHRIKMVKLFSTILVRDDYGGHWLRIPNEQHKVDVEDSAYVSKSIAFEGSGPDQCIKVITTLDAEYEITADTPLVMRGAVPYIRLDTGCEVRIARPHYYELAEKALREDGHAILYSNGEPFDLGKIE